MRKAKWAVTVVKKQLQGCCTYGRLPVDDNEGDDARDVSEGSSEGSEAAVVEYVAPEPMLVSNGKLTNEPALHVSVREEERRPSIKPLDALLPLTTAVSPKIPSRYLQRVKSGPLPHLASTRAAGATAANASPNDPSRFKQVYRSGPLPSLACAKGTGTTPTGPSLKSPLRTKHVSGPLPYLQSGRAVGSPASNVVADSKRLGHSGPLMPTKLLDRRGSRGSREVEQRRGAEYEIQQVEPAAAIRSCQSPTLHCDKETAAAARGTGRDETWAAIKIQTFFRGYRARRTMAAFLQGCPMRRLPKELLARAQPAGTEMSRAETQRRRKPPPVPTASKGWNASMRTAQDCQALLRKKQEAAMKRERALQYALSLQRWKTGSKSQKSLHFNADDKVPDKPGWVWSWLERAARMGAHGPRDNRIFDNDSDPKDLQSESLSVKSTVGMCTTEIASCDIDLGWQNSDRWPLSLRQQHAAGLLQPSHGPSPLQKSVIPDPQQVGKTSNVPGPSIFPASDMIRPRNANGRAQIQRDDESTTAESCMSPASVASFNYARIFSARRLTFCGAGSVKDDQESVGSCAGPVQAISRYKLTSHFAGPPSYGGLACGQQRKLSTSNSNKASALCQAQVSVELCDDDSIGTTAASLRRPFWRP